MRRITVVLLVSCSTAPEPATSGTETAPSSTAAKAAPSASSMDAFCASEPPGDGLACNSSGYCVRPPTDEKDGVHCYCPEGRSRCQSVLTRAPTGRPCKPFEQMKVLVYESGVVIGWSCLCPAKSETDTNTEWLCTPPPPG